jgi:hypothetical protein
MVKNDGFRGIINDCLHFFSRKSAPRIAWCATPSITTHSKVSFLDIFSEAHPNIFNTDPETDSSGGHFFKRGVRDRDSQINIKASLDSIDLAPVSMRARKGMSWIGTLINGRHEPVPAAEAITSFPGF